MQIACGDVLEELFVLHLRNPDDVLCFGVFLGCLGGCQVTLGPGADDVRSIIRVGRFREQVICVIERHETFRVFCADKDA